MLNLYLCQQFRLKPEPTSESFELLEHLGDAGANHLALVAQRQELGARGVRVGEAGPKTLDFLRQPMVLVLRTRLRRAELDDHRDETRDLFFETIDGLEIDRV